MLPIALVLACSGGGTSAPEPDPVPAAVEDPSTEPPRLDKPTLVAAASGATLVPSPTEMQRALADAGIDRGLSNLVPPQRKAKPTEDRDGVAVRVGMDIAYALLTLTDAPTDALLERIARVRAGVERLEAGTDISAVLDDLVARLKSDSLSRGGMLAELDEMHGAVLPELQFEADARLVPLIQAGSWLAGVNLVATAILKAEDAAAGTRLLRQPEVAEYFLAFVRPDGDPHPPGTMMANLQAALTDLQRVAGKNELTLDDVDHIRVQTNAVLEML